MSAWSGVPCLSRCGVRGQELADGSGDEVVAHAGAKHDVLGEERAGELSGGFVDVDGGAEVASLRCGGEDVVDGLEDAADEALLNDNEDSVTVGVIEESRKDDAERSDRKSVV